MDGAMAGFDGFKQLYRVGLSNFWGPKCFFFFISITCKILIYTNKVASISNLQKCLSCSCLCIPIVLGSTLTNDFLQYT